MIDKCTETETELELYNYPTLRVYIGRILDGVNSPTESNPSLRSARSYILIYDFVGLL